MTKTAQIMQKILQQLVPKDPANIYLFKITIEILEKGVNMFKVNNKNTKTLSLASFCCYC